MKADKISESGTIGKDGKLRLPMDRLNAWFASHPGERITVRFEAAPQHSTAAQTAYYYNYIVPTITAALYEQQGVRNSEKNTDKWLVAMYPGDTTERVLGTCADILEAREFDKNQMSDFLEWLKQFGAEELSVYIEDPKTI